MSLWLLNQQVIELIMFGYQYKEYTRSCSIIKFFEVFIPCKAKTAHVFVLPCIITSITMSAMCWVKEKCSY